MTEAPRGPQRRGQLLREKILTKADALFYRDGVRAVGVDTIVAECGIAKTSLYRWFPTKDRLISAVLELRNEQFWDQWEKVATRHAGRPREELGAHLEWIGRHVMSRGYRGCPFLNATAAFPELSHPARAVCSVNKGRLHEELLTLSKGVGVEDPELLADQLMLLIEGAFANAPVLGKRSPARALAAAGRALIDASA